MYPCWWIGKKGDVFIKMEIVIIKGGRQLLWKLIRKGSSYKERNKIVKLENEVVIFEIVFGMGSVDDHTKDSKKTPYTSSNYSSMEHEQNLLWNYGLTSLAMFAIGHLGFFCEIILFQNFVLQLKFFSSFIIHWSSSCMHFAFVCVSHQMLLLRFIRIAKLCKIAFCLRPKACSSVKKFGQSHDHEKISFANLFNSKI